MNDAFATRTAPATEGFGATGPNGPLAALVVLGVLLSFFVGLGSVPLFDLDEGAFSEATREMLLRGDFVSTYLNGVPRYDKPVLVYWLQAVSVLAFGLSEFALRLPSALCATAWTALVFLFVRRLRGTGHGLVAAGITATAAGITVIGRAAIADALLNMLLTAACASAFLYLHEGDRRWARAAFVAIGFGLLAKGPVAVLVPLATSFLFCLTKRGSVGLWLRGVTDLPGILLMLAIAAPWYIAQYLQEGDAFVRGFLLKHNVERFASPMHGFDGSVLFYVPWLFVATLPFLGPLVNAFAKLPLAWRDDLQRYCLLWFGFVFLFFSLSGTKLPHYVFYGYTGLFVVMALQVPAARRPWALLLPAALVFGLLLSLPFGLEQAGSQVRDAYYREALADVRSQFGAAYYLTCAALFAASIAALFLRRAPGTRVVATGCALSAVIALFVLPAAGRVQQAPVKEAALLAKARDYQVVMWGLDTPSFILYSGRLVEKRDPRPGEIALAKVKRLHELPGYDVLYRKNGIALVRVREAAK